MGGGQSWERAAAPRLFLAACFRGGGSSAGGVAEGGRGGSGGGRPPDRDPRRTTLHTSREGEDDVGSIPGSFLFLGGVVEAV
jgi:hypothetical protein